MFLPDVQTYSNKKTIFCITDCCVWDFISLTIARPPPPTLVSCTLTGPPTRFHLEEQQLRSPGHMTSKGANQQVRSKPNHERVSVACCTQHSFTLLRFRGSLSNVLGTSQRCCSTSVSPLPLAACPFILPSLSQLVHPLSSPPIPRPSPPHVSEPAERATRFQQLLQSSLA